MPGELYTIPTRLDSLDVRSAITSEYPEVDDRHYLANGCLCHRYIDRTVGVQVRVVESPASGVHAEILGDSGLWLRIRAVAVRVATAKAADA